MTLKPSPPTILNSQRPASPEKCSPEVEDQFANTNIRPRTGRRSCLALAPAWVKIAPTSTEPGLQLRRRTHRTLGRRPDDGHVEMWSYPTQMTISTATVTRANATPWASRLAGHVVKSHARPRPVIPTNVQVISMRTRPFLILAVSVLTVAIGRLWMSF